MTFAAIAVMLCLLVALAIGGYWALTGPLAKFREIEVHTVNRVVATDHLGFMPRGDFKPAPLSGSPTLAPARRRAG